MKKLTTAAKIRAYQEKHPNASAKEVAEKFKTTPTYVYAIRHNDKNPVPKTPKPEWKVLQTLTSSRQAQIKRSLDADHIFELTKGRDRSEEPKADNVNHPAHYKVGGIETIDFIQAKLSPEEFRGYLKGNMLKYLSRASNKGNYEEDMLKARWYLNREVATFQKQD